MKKNRKKYNRHKRYRSIATKDNRIKNITIVISITIGIIGIALIKQGISYGENITPIYSYTAQKSDNYEIILKPNKFYTTPTLPSGGYYASKSINNISINLKYELEGKEQNNLKYNYNIIANLVGKEKDNLNSDKEIWNRDFVLYENNNQLNENNILIDEKINIDYEFFNNLVNEYEKTYDIAIDAELKVKLNIFYYIDNSNNKNNLNKKDDINNSNNNIENEKIEDYMELDIPLTDTVTEVKENYENNTTQNIFPKIENKQKIKNIFYVLGGFSIIGAIFTFLIAIRNNQKTPEEIYKRNIKHILKYYGDLIITVTNEPNVENLQKMNVQKLEDLIDVAEQNQRNIIYHELIKNQKSNFYVIIDKFAYVYEQNI